MYKIIMVWSGRRTGHRQRSQSKMETTAGVRQSGLIVQQQTIFSTHKILLLFLCCFTSTEARWLIRDGDRVGIGRKSEGSTAETSRKRPERPWTAARTMEVLRRCPLAIAQRLVHCATAVSTAVFGQSHKDNVRCTAKRKKSNFRAQLHLPTLDLFWNNLRVQLRLPPLRSLDLLITPGTLPQNPHSHA